MPELTYESAGVNRTIAEQAKDRIKEIVRSTHNPNVLKGIGLFSGFYRLNAEQYTNPVLVSSIDGVGTKVKIAQMLGEYESLGEDLVNHSVNDIMVCGADPLFFLDYIATDKLDVEATSQILRGMSRACSDANCSVVAGETAEMPGVYAPDSFDIAGCIVGVVDKDSIIDGSTIRPGDVLIGIASNGLHTNGYSLARKVFFDLNSYAVTDYLEKIQSTLGAALLKPHRSYRKIIQAVRGLPGLHGIAHVTGGGIAGNAKRLLRDNLGLTVDWSSWHVPSIFEIIQSEGDVSEAEMQMVFNLGVGLTLVVARESVEEILAHCDSNDESGFVIGAVTER